MNDNTIVNVVVELFSLRAGHIRNKRLKGKQSHKNRYEPELNPQPGDFQHNPLMAVPQ